MSFWLKDQDGDPSVIVTLVAVSFVTTSLAYILSIVDKVGPVSIRPFDVSAGGMYFGSILAAWTGHKWVSAKYDGSSSTSTSTSSTTSTSNQPAPQQTSPTAGG